MPKRFDFDFDDDNVLDRDPITRQNTGIKPKIQKPSMYKVICHNDDFTPITVVIFLLEKHFNKSVEAATELALAIHFQGLCIAGVFPREIAEEKANAVMDEAKKDGFPFKCSIEKE